jgi:hypothetical protein
MRLGAEALRQFASDPRFADARFTRDQHDLAIASLGARPAAQPAGCDDRRFAAAANRSNTDPDFGVAVVRQRLDRLIPLG